MKVPSPPSYDEAIETEATEDSNNVYPQITEINDKQSLQPLIGVHVQNVNVPNLQPNVNQVLGPYPQQVYCLTCKQHTLTETKYISGFYTWTLALLFVIFGFILCCYIPFCVNSFKDCQHFCTQCHNYIGTYERSSRRDEKRRSVIVFCLCLFLFLLIYYLSAIYTSPETRL